MNKTTIKNTLKTIALGVGAVSAHHYGSKLLDRNETIENNAMEEQKYMTTQDKLNIIIEKQDTIIKNQANQEEAKNKLTECTDSLFKMNSSLEAGNLDEAKAHSNVVKDCLDKVFDIYNNSSNKFNMNLNAYYDYLDSLTLLQESSLLHIIIYIIIILSLISLMTTLFANELIKYFDLENKHRYLKKILMIRSKFQRYYFIFDFSLLYLIIIGMIILDLIAFLK